MRRGILVPGTSNAAGYDRQSEVQLGIVFVLETDFRRGRLGLSSENISVMNFALKNAEYPSISDRFTYSIANNASGMTCLDS